MSLTTLRVMAIGGLSCGHTYPALAFLDALKLKDKNAKALLVLPKRASKSNITSTDRQVRYLSIVNISLRLNRASLLSLIGFLKGIFESVFLLIEFRPDMVVGFGSIVSLPLIVLAWLFRIKTMIHEQNLEPGKANRFLSFLSDRIAVSFKDTIALLPEHLARKAVFTGNPLRKELVQVEKKAAARFFGFDPDRLSLLVMGGSSGSHNINLSFMDAIASLRKKDSLQVIHLTGTKDYPFLKQSYAQSGICARVFSFFDQMQYAYSAVTLVICRAGALSLAEIIAFRLPAIIIPYRYASGHQSANAAALEKKGAILVIKDEELSAEILSATLERLLENNDRIDKMRQAFGDIHIPDAGGRLLNEVYAR